MSGPAAGCGINASVNRLYFSAVLTGIACAVILTAEAYEQMEQAVAEVEATQVREIVEARLSSYGAGRTSPQAAVAQRVRARRRKK